jgi:hypothetical protein
LSVCAGQQVQPACAHGQVVRIVSAVWGRQSAPDAAQPSLFAPNDATKCAAPPAHVKPPGGAAAWDALASSQCAADVSDLVRAQCQGRHACAVQAERALLPDPCPTVWKYLALEYTCVAGMFFLLSFHWTRLV